MLLYVQCHFPVQIDDFEAVEDDPSWSINIKRAILNTFHLSLVDKEEPKDEVRREALSGRQSEQTNEVRSRQSPSNKPTGQSSSDDEDNYYTVVEVCKRYTSKGSKASFVSYPFLNFVHFLLFRFYWEFRTALLADAKCLTSSWSSPMRPRKSTRSMRTRTTRRARPPAAANSASNRLANSSPASSPTSTSSTSPRPSTTATVNSSLSSSRDST